MSSNGLMQLLQSSAATNAFKDVVLVAWALRPQSLVGDVDKAELFKSQLLTDQSTLLLFRCSAEPWVPVLVLGFRLADLTVPEILASTSLSCPAVPHSRGPGPPYNSNHITVLNRPTPELDLFAVTKTSLLWAGRSLHFSTRKHSATKRILGHVHPVFVFTVLRVSTILVSASFARSPAPQGGPQIL